MTIQLQGIIYCLVQFPIIFSYFAGIMLNAHAFIDPLCLSFKIGRSLISSKEIVHKPVFDPLRQLVQVHFCNRLLI